MDTFDEYKNTNSSEKIVLVRVKGSRRLMGWSVDVGSRYVFTDFSAVEIVQLSQSGIVLTEVASLAAVVPGTYFNDRENKSLYLETSDSTHPNGKFISVKQWFHFSNVPIHAPHDMTDGGLEIYWEPMVKTTSDFGVALDNQEQLGFAIEGSGSVSFYNDRDFWEPNFEGIVWDNQEIEVYQWTRDIPIDQAAVLFKGRVNGKSFSSNSVQFKVKDTLGELRQPYPVENLGDLGGVLIADGLNSAKQRRIYGRVAGFRPTNIDQLPDTGYVLAGTLSISPGTANVVGVGTSFLTWFSPDDEIVVQFLGKDEEFTVRSVTNDTTMTLTESVDFEVVGQSVRIKPALPKKFINRQWLIAGHECCHPTRFVSETFLSHKFYVNSVQDFRIGDELLVGTGPTAENIEIESINNNLVRFAQSLAAAPVLNSPVIRPCVQNVRINDLKLEFNRDFFINFVGGKTYLELSEDAEKNVHSVRRVNGSMTFTNGSRAVTGSGTQFTAQLTPNQWVRGAGNFDFFEILSIESDTALTLRTPATYSDAGDSYYIEGLPFDPEFDVLSCEVIGTTDTGLYTGRLLETSPDVVEHVLESVGVTGLNAASFQKSNAICPHVVGFVIPEKFSDTNVKTARDYINMVNVSVFGSVVQNEDFELEYNILRPNRPPSALSIKETDVLSWSLEHTNDRVVRIAKVEWKRKEYDFETKAMSVQVKSKTSDVANYLVETKNERVIQSVLYDEDSARMFSNRWSYLLELGSNVVKIKTKLQTTKLQVNDIVRLEHRKLFERLGGGKVKFAAVQAIKKSGSGVEIELDDLSNAFNRVGIICENDALEWADATTEDRQKNGFITDNYGLIENNPQTFGLNVIW